MDRSLDEIISERPRGGRRPDRGPPRAPRREEPPRDGIRKNRYDDRTNIDTDWVHDRFEDERYERRRRDSPQYGDRMDVPRGGRRDPQPSEPGARLRVENLHYDLTEDDILELFSRIGRVASARLLYDRADRSEGVAFVTYQDPRDAREAIREFNGANANGQPIRISLAAAAPTRNAGGSLFERVEKPGRSLFDRVEGGRARDDRRNGRGGRARSYSPRGARDGEDVDRYRPEPRGSRSPRARGGPRERGRRPGARREESGRGGRKPRTDEKGRALVGGRPKKTAEELDAEMADYFGNASEPATSTNEPAQQKASNATATNADDDIDMIT